MSISNVQKVWKVGIKGWHENNKYWIEHLTIPSKEKTHGAIFRHFELNTTTCWLDKGEWDRYHNDDIPLQTLDNYPAVQLLSVINTSLTATQTNCISQISHPPAKYQISQISNISKTISNKLHHPDLPAAAATKTSNISFPSLKWHKSSLQIPREEPTLAASVNSLNSIHFSILSTKFNFVVCA